MLGLVRFVRAVSAMRDAPVLADAFAVWRRGISFVSRYDAFRYVL